MITPTLPAQAGLVGYGSIESTSRYSTAARTRRLALSSVDNHQNCRAARFQRLVRGVAQFGRSCRLSDG